MGDIDNRPERYAEWVESLPDDAEFCSCPGVTWVNRDATTSRPCRSCGKLRNDDLCVVGTNNPKHVRKGCRSADNDHMRHAAWMMKTGQLLGAREREVLGAREREVEDVTDAIINEAVKQGLDTTAMTEDELHRFTFATLRQWEDDGRDLGGPVRAHD